MTGTPGANDVDVREPAPVSGNGRDTVFGRSLRYEIAGEEGRALLGSYIFAFALGIAWLAIVYFGPRTLPMRLLSPDEQPIAVTFDALEPNANAAPEGAEGDAVRVPAPGAPDRGEGARSDRAGRPRQGNAGGRQATATSAGAIADAFGSGSGTGSGGLVGDVSNVVLGSGEGGEGARTPGRGGIGGTSGAAGGAGGGIGGVGPGGGTVSRTPVRIAPPRPIDAPSVRGVQRDVSELGTFVRGRESQLRFCYNEYGLKVNPDLAGSVTAAVTLAPAGNVTGVNVTNRTWSGTGASDTERCILDKIRAWRFPASEAGGGTFSFSFSFTR